MLSVDTNEVSSEPGSEVWKSWKMKFDFASCGFQMKMRSTQKYCAPGLEFRLAQAGFSGSFGGLLGAGPTWQKPHDMPTR